MRSHKLAYLMVAATCALLHNVILIGLDAAGVDYVSASVVSFVVVVVVGYQLHRRFTFDSPAVRFGMLRYAWAMAANLPLSVLGLFVFHTLVGLPMAIAAPLTVGSLFLINFALARWAIVGSPAPARLGEPT